MVYFYPGQFSGDENVLEEYPEPVSGCFCMKHAKEIQENRCKQLYDKENPRS